MGSEWKETTIGDLCKKVVTGGTPLTSNEAFYQNAYIPWLKTKEVNFCRIYETENHISEIALRESSVKLIPENSVIVAMYGQGDTAGRVAINKIPLTTNQACCNLIIDEEKADYRYVYFYLKNSYQELVRRKTGSAQPNLNTSIVKAFEISVPSLSEQKNVAGFLTAIDDKIALNRQINNTLESMAQALFKSWFVDFDPVIDNALAAGNEIPDELAARAARREALRQQTNKTTEAIDAASSEQALPETGLSEQRLPSEIQQLFPDRFVLTDEMGWVPEGWVVSCIGNFLNVLETGRRPKGGVAKYDSGIPSVGAESINGIGNFDFGKTKFLPVEFFEKMKSGIVQDYDVLLYKDGGKPGDFKPRIGMFGEKFPFDVYAINEHVFRLRSDILGQPFLYYQVSSEASFHDLAVRGGKAAIPGINQGDVKALIFPLPCPELLKAFNVRTQSMFKTILRNSQQSLTLQHLRDSLLPKLLSGQITIPDAEQQLAEVL